MPNPPAQLSRPPFLMGCNAASVLPVLALSEFLVIYSVLCILFVFSERAPLPNTTVRLPVSTRYYLRSRRLPTN
ncbi:hypothetical protein IWW34DRAFT_706226 [Fusarium oxysporum f. sp. albedinis]|nr:hypothetical protein IWW34DRAFT_706226 [Fusarium oxysporum f. sp. albedinis]